ncbi:hypothetical protein KFU94_27360 [Chloroflexi bacterium TSY]|nr:hypothetical protein [Chloroflexi bacterium TSY]
MANYDKAIESVGSLEPALAQTIISIENATLCNTLEEKVVERTAQLAVVNEEIQALNEQLTEQICAWRRTGRNAP